MANTKEIQERMKSIQDTMKITNAMYMISSSKLKKSRKSLEATEPYFYTLQSTMRRILRHLPNVESIYFRDTSKIEEHQKKIGYIVVTADKGLAGAYNHNVTKMAEQHLSKGCNNKLYVLGELGRHYFEKHGITIDQQFHYTVQNPTLSRARNMTEFILDLYKNKELDEIYVIYTRMMNAITVEPQLLQLLPLKREDFKQKVPSDIFAEELSFLPSPEAVVDHIVPDFLVGFIYGALVESFSSEQNSRMQAMESATNSARDMLHDLTILYNRARQAAITQEITEVIAGAKAQKKKKKR
ncbi:MAG: ATP synthase F1 subunit gamma [Lachnospiraceae bacterium]